MNLSQAIKAEIEARKQDKQYQALQRAYLKSQFKIIRPGQDLEKETTEKKQV